MNHRIDWLLDCEPRPAQMEALARSYTGFRWRTTRDDEPVCRPLAHQGRPASGWGHFMEPRVGKTPTALNEFMLFSRDYGVKKGLIFAPARYKHAWVSEAARFGLTIPLHVFESSNRKGFAAFMKSCRGEGLVSINYEAVIQPDTVKMLAEWIDSRTYVAADESVSIKNPTGMVFKALMSLVKPAAVTRPLTGLPAPQGPHDLWAQLRFARQISGFEFHPFKHTFCELGGFRGRKVKGTKNPERLDALLENACFRAKRVDWGTKIDSDFEEVSLPMTPRQLQAYKEMEEDFIAWLDGGGCVTADQVITKRMKMQQISSGFVIDNEGKVQWLLPFDKTPKLLDLKERLATEVPGKTIIIAHYTATIEGLADALAEYNPAMIYGEQNMKRRSLNAEEEKKRFNNDPECRVILGQSQSIKYGHTLMGTPGDPCLDLCFYENNYSLDNRRQSEERPQGEGQAGAIHIWDYYSSPVEREIVRALQRKASIADAIMTAYGRAT